MQKWLQMAQNALGRQSGEAGKEKRIIHGPFNQGFESFLATFTLKTWFLVIDLFFVVISSPMVFTSILACALHPVIKPARRIRLN